MDSARREMILKTGRWLFRLGLVALMLAYFVAIVVIGYLLWRNTGGRASLESLCVYPLFALVMFSWAVVAGAEFIRQLYALETRWDGLWFLVGALSGMGSGYAWIAHGEISAESRESSTIRIGGPGSIGLANDSAAVLECGGRFSRVVGPGYSYLKPFETVRAAVDLRPQHRTATARAITRDGIPVRADIEMDYRIGEPVQPGQAPARVRRRRGLRRRLLALLGAETRSALPELPYSYSEESVCRAVYGNRVMKPGPAGAWDAALPNLVASRLEDLLAQYQFDKLFDPDPATPRQLPRDRLQTDVKQAASQILTSRGVVLIRITLGNVEVDTDVASLKNAVQEQRIQAWQADWVRQDLAKVGKSRAEALKIRERARAQVQRDMINAISDALTSSPTSGEPPEQAVAWRFIQALEQMARTSATSEYLTTEQLLGEDMLQKLSVLRGSLAGPALPATGQGDAPSLPAAPAASSPDPDAADPQS